ncbi:MAG: hypothetical protein KAS32_14190 [Candidatus Peribacteraceae bacterium]|nr:hypothetical protein [Candidatus Peribacteraceae bacterium]
MKREEVIPIWNVLDSLGDEKAGVAFSYMVAKNQAAIKDEYESVMKAIAPTKAFQKYEELRLEVVRNNATKNEQGQLDMVNGNVIISPDSIDKLKEELEKLNIEHKDAIEEREAQMKEAEEFFEQEIDLKLEVINMNDFPETLTPNQMKHLIQFVKET